MALLDQEAHFKFRRAGALKGEEEGFCFPVRISWSF